MRLLKSALVLKQKHGRVGPSRVLLLSPISPLPVFVYVA